MKGKVFIMKNIVIDNISTSYFITEKGQCYNNNTGKYLKGQANPKNNYISFNLTLPNGKKKRCYAHRLVAQAFIPNSDPMKVEVNHKDGDKQNNCVDNLEWVTKAENAQHALKNELRKFKHVFCFNKDKELVAEYKTIPEAAIAVQSSYSVIQAALTQTPKVLAKGFYWSRNPVLEETKVYQNLGKAKEVYQYDLNGKFINKYSSTGEAARSLGISKGTHIGECCRGKLKTCKGFIWRYTEDVVSPSGESQR